MMGWSKKITKGFIWSIILSLMFSFLPMSYPGVQAADSDMLIVNPSFEDELNGWTTDGSSAISVQWRDPSWYPEELGTYALSFWDDKDFVAEVHQTVTNLADGSYTLSAWVSSGGILNAYMYAEDGDGNKVQINLPVTDTMTKISLAVEVENETLTVGFYADGKAEAWAAIDLVEISTVPEVILDPRGVEVPNRDFELDGESNHISHWSVEGSAAAVSTKGPGFQSAYALSHSSDVPYTVRTYQVLTGLEDGYYSLTAWVQNSGGQRAVYLYGYVEGQSESRTILPVSDTWLKVYVRGIHVVNGTATIGLYSDSDAGYWVKIDLIELIKDDIPYRLLKGGDVSQLSYIEAMGGKFYDRNGIEKDVFQILKENGHDIVRLRLYNNPGKGRGDGVYYVPEGIMDKADVLKLAKRAHEAGLQIQLSFHYSDYWTNGAIQYIPHDWQTEIEGLTGETVIVDKLEQLVYEYTVDVMQAMQLQGTTPQYVSLGNEMQSGILYPYGRASGTSWNNLARFLQAGYDAVKSVSPDTRVILHLDDAGNYGKYENFFDKLIELNVDFDIIGASYYPFWTNLNVAQAVQFFNDMVDKYGKDIMIMETGFKWNHTLPNGQLGQLTHNGPYPDSASTPEGQREFMIELFNGLKSVKDGRVIGDLYWDPIMIAVPGVGWAIREADDQADVNVVSNTTLFDFDGYALPVHDAYLYNTEGTNKGVLAGVVKGTSGRRIAHAQVTLNMNGNTVTTYADKNGNYLFPNVLPGTNYELKAGKPGYHDGFATVTSVTYGEFVKQQIIIAGAGFSGTVRDEQGNPSAGTRVEITAGQDTFVAETDQSGAYVLEDLPEGNDYTVVASKIGYQKDTVHIEELKIGQPLTDVDLTLTLNSGTISGIVQSEDGEPIEGALVSVVADGMTFSDVSDADGVFTIEHVPSGSSHTVKATKKNFVPGEVSNVSVATGQTTESILLTLIPSLGNITGVVTDSEKQPVAGAEVSMIVDGVQYSAITNNAGKYTLESVPAGEKYTVRASKNSYYDGITEDVQVEVKKTTANVDIRLITPIQLENSGFEIQGENQYEIPGWNVAGTEYGTFIQSHASAKEGKYVLSSWMEQPFISDVSQTLIGLKDGVYVLTAWFYNGGDLNEYYMYAKDRTGNMVKLDIPQTNQMTPFSLEVEAEGGQLTIGFYADANTGNWMLVDEVRLGFKGPKPSSTPGRPGGFIPISPDETAGPATPIELDVNMGTLNEQGDEIHFQVEVAEDSSSVSVRISWNQFTAAEFQQLKRIHVDMGIATIVLAASLFEDGIDSDAGNIELSVDIVDRADLSEEILHLTKDQPVYEFNLSIDGRRLDPFSGKEVTVEIPYALEAGQSQQKVVVYYIDEDGTSEIVKNGKYNERSGTVTFSPKHFSQYAALYQDMTFPDLSNVDWAKESIEALAVRNIVKGYPDQTFKPADNVTRAQFVQMLIGVLDIEAVEDVSSFSDVKDGEWYTSAIITAERLGIVHGKSDGTFGIDEAISRQDMAVMIRRAMRLLEVETFVSGELQPFSDLGEISAYALEDIQQLQRMGLIQGMGDGTFRPHVYTKRAEAAVLLNQLRLIVH